MNEIENMVAHLERQKEAIDRALSALREVGSGTVSVQDVIEDKIPGRRRLSAAARKKMAEAARKRWAMKKSQSSDQPKSAAKAKKTGGISEAGRNKLAEAMKRRWAVKRAAGKAAGTAKRAVKKAAAAKEA